MSVSYLKMKVLKPIWICKSKLDQPVIASGLPFYTNSIHPGKLLIGIFESDAVLKICADQSIDAVIPGYGFLSENAEFCRRVEGAGMVFVGPDANTINRMGLKHVARDLAIAAQVPIIEGSGLLENASAALQEARVVGFPVCNTCCPVLYTLVRDSLNKGHNQSVWGWRWHGPTNLLQ